MPKDTTAWKGKGLTERQLRQLQALAETMRYGSISLIFQDGVLVQIDRNEKIRMTNSAG